MEENNQRIVFIDNWNELCRLCLCNDQPLQNMFAEDALLESVREATNLSFDVDDPLPNSVCKMCIDQVNLFIEFRERCKSTDCWLRQEAMVSNNDEHKSSITIDPDLMNTKHLLVEPDQFEEQLIDDPPPIENEIELAQCNIQTEEIMQVSITGKETLGISTTDDYKCTVCNKELLSAYTLANHMRSHTGERPFGCRVCEKFFKTKSNLNEHYRVHNPELRWMKTSSRDIPSITRVTVTSEDALTCGDCGQSFESLDALSAHERRTHGGGGGERLREPSDRHEHDVIVEEEEEEEENENEEEENEEEEEEENEDDGGEMKEMVDDDGGGLVEDAGRQLQQRRRTAAFGCEQCGKHFGSKSRLSAHGNCSDVSRKCPFCGKTFRSAATLENHKRVHTREKPFVCDVCTKPFRTKGNMLEHKRVHDNSPWLTKGDAKVADVAAAPDDGFCGGGSADRHSQRFRCTYCTKPFRTYTALLNHERVHTREKPFECSVCEKCFRTKSNLTEHMKGCHDVDASVAGHSDEVQVFTFKTQSATHHHHHHHHHNHNHNHNHHRHQTNSVKRRETASLS